MVPLRKTRIAVPDDLAAVTTAATEREVDPEAVGVARPARDAIWAAVEDFYATGLHPAIALCIRRRGEVLLDRAIGHAAGAGPDDPPGAPRVPATPDTPFCISSASKAVTALLIHHLDDEGLLHIDDRVAEYIPEFARHGKERTTIRHVLTHRAGIPSVGGPGDLDLLGDWETVVELLCDAEPVSVPGRRLAYHAVTGGFVLGEVVRRVTGRDVRTYLRDVALDPLGFRGMSYGVDPEEVPRVARNAFTGRDVPFPLSVLVRRAIGVSLREAVAISNDARYLTGIVSAGNIVATAGEAARFYQLLLEEGELDGVRVFDARTVRRARTESSYLEVDPTLAVPIRYGLGLMLGGEVASLFGPGTPQAFGHLGFIHILTWADPQRDLAAALITTGKPFVGVHLYRLYRLLAAIARGCPR